ncbi:LCP family protein [Micromonospora sp. NBC_01796]|uniref:LCP family protein n=1 Tax=Micromonospora sp. NBC_01796 TaxID=2975987 RepID=UPI003FA3ACD8
MGREQPEHSDRKADSSSSGGSGRGRAKRVRRTARWPKVLLGIGIGLVLIAVVAGLGLRGVTQRYDNSVAKELLLDPAARRDRAAGNGPLNYLLVGSDRRAATAQSDQRADTILIVHIPAGLNRAYLISVPRDLLVEIPPSPANAYPGGSDKINSAFHYGGGGQPGARLLSATLTQITGLRFDGAALIDFSGFRKVIDLLGGVKMCVDTPVRSIHTNVQFNPGCQDMNGATALDYARQRYDLPAGDFDRQRHQQQLLRAIMDKASASDLRTNPLKLDQVIRAVGASLTVDTNGKPTQDILFDLRGLRPEAMRGIQVPSRSEMIGDTSYVVLDDSATGLFQALRGPDLDGWAQANPKWVNKL